MIPTHVPYAFSLEPGFGDYVTRLVAGYLIKAHCLLLADRSKNDLEKRLHQNMSR